MVFEFFNVGTKFALSTVLIDDSLVNVHLLKWLGHQSGRLRIRVVEHRHVAHFTSYCLSIVTLTLNVLLRLAQVWELALVKLNLVERQLFIALLKLLTFFVKISIALRHFLVLLLFSSVNFALNDFVSGFNFPSNGSELVYWGQWHLGMNITDS